MQVFGLIGNPVGHSLSPPMHEAAYRACGMDARYVTFEPDRDAADEAVRGAESLGVAGLNVTIPFKRDVLDAVEPDELAARIGATVHVANRTVERAEELAAAVPDATGGGLDTLDRVSEAAILINATSVGMESDETPVPEEHLHADLAVLDAVYAPLDTRLLREAREAGATAIDGAWMLLYQGVVAFERWTGRDPPVDEMNTALRTALRNRDEL